MPKSMLTARSIRTSGPGQLTLYNFQTAAKKRKASLNTSDGAASSSRQGDTCMSKAVGMKITKWVYIYRTKPVKHPKPKEATV